MPYSIIIPLLKARNCDFKCPYCKRKYKWNKSIKSSKLDYEDMKKIFGGLKLIEGEKYPTEGYSHVCVCNNLFYVFELPNWYENTLTGKKHAAYCTTLEVGVAPAKFISEVLPLNSRLEQGPKV